MLRAVKSALPPSPSSISAGHHCGGHVFNSTETNVSVGDEEENMYEFVRVLYDSCHLLCRLPTWMPDEPSLLASCPSHSTARTIESRETMFDTRRRFIKDAR
jgi:hypothetical protein